MKDPLTQLCGVAVRNPRRIGPKARTGGDVFLFRVTDSAANTAETVHLLNHPDPEDTLHAPQALHRLFGGVVV